MQSTNYINSSRVGENKLPKSYRNQNKKQRHKATARQATPGVEEAEQLAEAETEQQQPAKQPKLTA